MLEERADRYLRAAWRAFTTELLVEAGELAAADSAIAQAQREVRFEDVHFQVSPIAEPMADGRGGEVLPDDAPAAASIADLVLSTSVASSGRMRFASGTVIFHRRRWMVVAGHSLAPTRDTVVSVFLAYAFTLPLVLGVALVGGYAAAQRALAPVAAMGHRARAIEAATLHDGFRRNPDDELGELAVVINALLARLEAAFAQQRRLVADVSHELRTPVAVLLAEADVLLTREGRPEAEYRERIGVLRDAAARLARLVDDLFLLTRADSGHLSPRREPLYLDEVVHDAVRTMQVVAALRGVHLVLDIAPELTTAIATSEGDTASDTERDATSDAERDAADDIVSPGAPMEGDPVLLDRLLLNLLDNAIKHSPPDARVTISLERLEVPEAHPRYMLRRYVLRIADAGPGIPPEAQAHVFDRFFRVDQARSRTGTNGTDPGGAGLGLAIARWVAEVHGGSLEVEHSSSAGTTLRLELPMESDSPDDAHPDATSGS